MYESNHAQAHMSPGVLVGRGRLRKNLSPLYQLCILHQAPGAERHTMGRRHAPGAPLKVIVLSCDIP